MTNTTAQRVLDYLAGRPELQLKNEGSGLYRCNDPLRPGSDSLAFTLTINPDGEHGAFKNYNPQGGPEKGSLYDLAKLLKIELNHNGQHPQATTTKRAYTDLADYAQAHGVTADVFIKAGWGDKIIYQHPKKDPTFHNRPALPFTTKTGKKYRFIDGKKPTFMKAGLPSFFKLKEAINAQQPGQPLYLGNGESAVVVGQLYGIPVTTTTGGEGSKISQTHKARLLAELKTLYPTGQIIVVLDCDPTGRASAPALAALLTEAGYQARAVDLAMGNEGQDLCDFCKLHGSEAAAELQKLKELTPPPEIVTPTKPPANPWTVIDLMLDLPQYARLNQSQEREALDNNPYLNTYTEYSQARVPMLPTHFHESAALFLGAMAIARRLALKLPYETVYPNLYILWTAKTTIFNKTTAMKPLLEIVEEIMPHLRMVSEFSREAMIDSLSGKQPANLLDLSDDGQKRWRKGVGFAARRAIILDEASSLFSNLRREINIGMTELLMHLYDCTDYDRETKGGGLVKVRRPYLCFLGATTPVMLRQANNTQLWLSGLWPRFNHLVPQSLPTRLIDVADTVNRPDLITTHLDKLANHHLPTPESAYEFPEARSLIFPAEIREAHRNYRRALVEGVLMSATPPPEELFGIYGRLPTAALKVAIILAALDWDGQDNIPIIHPAHWYRAQMIAETWREGAHLLYRELNNAAELDTMEKQIIRTVVRKYGIDEDCARRDVYRALNKKSLEVNPFIDQLIEAGLLQEYSHEGRWAKLLKPGDRLQEGVL